MTPPLSKWNLSQYILLGAREAVCALLTLALLLLSLIALIILVPILVVGLLFISITVVLPFVFVGYAVPWLNSFLRRLIEGDAGAGSMAVFRRLPPEVLQEVFIHCCDNEYVDFFYHFSLQSGQEHQGGGSADHDQLRCNMVYTLKGVCREWKLLAEQTPPLWRKIQFGNQRQFDLNRDEGNNGFRSLQHCMDMMGKVLLPRSAGLPMQIRIARCGDSFHGRQRESQRIHMCYILPLLEFLSREGRRWESPAIEGCQVPPNVNPGPADLCHFNLLSSGRFPGLQTLTLHAKGGRLEQHGGYFASLPPRVDLSTRAPHISKLVLLGTWDGTTPRGGILENLVLRWSTITTLVMNLRASLESESMPIAEHTHEVLHTVRHNLIHLSWMGRLPDTVLRQRRDYDLLDLHFHSLRSLTLANHGDSRFSTTFLPLFTCPKLEELRIFWFTPEDQPRSQMPTLTGAIGAVKQLLLASSLRNVTILQGPAVGYHVLRSDEIGTGSGRSMKHGYLIFRGNASTCRTSIADRLCKDSGLSSQLPLLDLSRHSPKLVKHILSRIMAIVPWYEYSTDKERAPWAGYHLSTQTAVHPFRPVAKTPQERLLCDPYSSGDWSPLLLRTFAFVEDISSNVSVNIAPDMCTLQERAFATSVPLSNLYILARIFDMVRALEPSTSLEYTPGTSEQPCTFTIAVPL